MTQSLLRDVRDDKMGVYTDDHDPDLSLFVGTVCSYACGRVSSEESASG